MESLKINSYDNYIESLKNIQNNPDDASEVNMPLDESFIIVRNFLIKIRFYVKLFMHG